MSVEQMRKAVETVYPGLKWKERVSVMSNAQVIAVYYKFLGCNKLK